MKWIRFEHQGRSGFGTLQGDQVQPHDGDMFGQPVPAGAPLPLAALRLLPPCRPRLIVALWNNFRAAAQKNGWAEPAEPLVFLKSPHALSGPGDAIAVPRGDVGRVAYEGELVIVIGRRTEAVGVGEAAAHIFGYACGNDVTAIELLNRDASFAQWSRAKSFPGFAAFGPCIETEFDPAAVELVTRVGGRERQRYALADMFFGPHELVSRLSHDLVLEAGDLIYCGTSLGVLPMKPGSTVEVEVPGIGTLGNTYG
jgi:2-keto-4-pentenoate hydratase/2-oxohepta-3-ene-1,7-dioic acid hydratase in catechol pathway